MTAADFADLPHPTSQRGGSSRRRRKKERLVAVVPLQLLAPLSEPSAATPLTASLRRKGCAVPQSPGEGACGRQLGDRPPSGLHLSVQAGCRFRRPEPGAYPHSPPVLAPQATREVVPYWRPRWVRRPL